MNEEEQKHIRTINKVVKYFKEIDKDTAVTYRAIKEAVDQGFIPHAKVGKRILVVQEDVIDYFYNMGRNLCDKC